MGNCFFGSSNSKPIPTVKLIVVPDGTLYEFSYHVKVSSLLQKYPTTFICNSDDIDFDNVIKAINGDQMLQLGHLYFALPLSELERKLNGEEMAALAVKACSAIAKSSGRHKCGFQRKRIVVFPGNEGGNCYQKVAVEDDPDARKRGGKGRKLIRSLSSIRE